MNLFLRLRNLWRLSEYEIPKVGEKNFDIGTIHTGLIKKPEKVTILKKDLNLQDLIKTNDE